MILDVSSTRMELMKLKKKEEVSVKGHKLLKDKLDELIRLLLRYIRDWKNIMNEIDEEHDRVTELLNRSGVIASVTNVRSAFSSLSIKTEVVTNEERILNIPVPEYKLEKPANKFPLYGFIESSMAMDKAVDSTGRLLEKMIKLAEMEKRMTILSEEVLKTRRRVNALEYYMIPNIQDTIKSISMKLEEQDRNTKSQLMRIKDIIRAPKIRSSANPGGFKYKDI